MVRGLADPGALAAIRKELPLYILAGERAPMVSGIGNLDRLIERYRAAGLRPALVRYPQGRHENLKRDQSHRGRAKPAELAQPRHRPRR